jgi:hypothetical protein
MDLNRLRLLAGIDTLTESSELILEAAYDSMVDALKKQVPDKVSEIDARIKRMKPILVKQDRIVWYIKILRAYLTGKLPEVVGNYQFQSMDTFDDDFSHFYGLNINQIEATQLANQKVSELLGIFKRYEDEYTKSDKAPVKMQGDDRILFTFNDGTQWINTDRAYCEEEGRSGKHCGNVTGKSETDQRILSLRTKTHNVILTFILEPNGYLGEMKGKGNQKPLPKYHYQIMKLLLDPMIKGIKGAGFLPEANFSIFDLDERNIQLLISSGKESFISDQIAAEPMEFLKAPEYIRNNKKYQEVALSKLPGLKHILEGSDWESTLKEHPELTIYAPESLSNWKERVIACIVRYSNLLKAPTAIRYNFEIVSEVLNQKPGMIARVVPNTPRYSELAMIAINGGSSLSAIAEEHRTAEICKIAVEKNGHHLASVPTTVKNYNELVGIAVRGGVSLESVAEEYRTKAICEIAISKDKAELKYVPSTIDGYIDICVKALESGAHIRDVKVSGVSTGESNAYRSLLGHLQNAKSDKLKEVLSSYIGYSKTKDNKKAISVLSALVKQDDGYFYSVIDIVKLLSDDPKVYSELLGHCKPDYTIKTELVYDKYRSSYNIDAEPSEYLANVYNVIDYLPKSERVIIIDKLDKRILSVDKLLAKKIKETESNNISCNHSYISKISKTFGLDWRYTKQALADKLNQVNSYETIKAINKLSGKDFNDATSQHGESMKSLMNALSVFV